jgi:tetratricopeptide (TPR) repeat protein
MTSDSDYRTLPANPSISNLKKQAKSLKKAYASGDTDAVGRVNRFHPGATEITELTLRDAQLTVAREYGFDGWHELNVAVGERMVEERDLHRWFGTQLNNGSWAVIADGSVGPDSPVSDRESALYSAYASAYHWRMVGNEANKARGEHLIARVASAIGEPELALKHALRCLEIIEDNPNETSDWDEPFAYEAIARANAALGRMETARDALERAVDLTQAVSNEGDRNVLIEELAREPWFGLTTR